MDLVDKPEPHHLVFSCKLSELWPLPFRTPYQRRILLLFSDLFWALYPLRNARLKIIWLRNFTEVDQPPP